MGRRECKARGLGRCRQKTWALLRDNQSNLNPNASMRHVFCMVTCSALSRALDEHVMFAHVLCEVT